MNDEAKNDEKKLIDRHKKFFDLERNRFIQIINELDQIIDNCDRQMEDTLHELAAETERQNQAENNTGMSSTRQAHDSNNYMGGRLDDNRPSSTSGTLDEKSEIVDDNNHFSSSATITANVRSVNQVKNSIAPLDYDEKAYVNAKGSTPTASTVPKLDDSKT